MTNDPLLRELSIQAGVETEWTDNDGIARSVTAETQRHVLKSLGLHCSTPSQMSDSLALLKSERQATPQFLAARAHIPTALIWPALREQPARVLLENGSALNFDARDRGDGHVEIPAVDVPGYHTLAIGSHEITLAVAPARCYTIDDASAGKRIYGVAAQTYGLRHAASDRQDVLALRGMGSGDFGALCDLVRAAGKRGADAVGLSPAHALFAGDIDHCSPYSPSSRLFLNVLLADPLATFDAARVRAAIESSGMEAGARELAALNLIDWRRTGAARLALLRALYQSFADNERRQADDPLARDFAQFRKTGGAALHAHAQFEVLHTQEFARDFTRWHWRDWPADLRVQGSPALREHVQAHDDEIAFHIFAQWLAARSLAQAGRAAFDARMKIGLIGDLAVGLNDGGSQAWQRPDDFLAGLSIGAPPDALAPKGQNWGLAAFSPRALRAQGYRPFIETLRAAMRHCGGLRIDHVMGLARLWLVPKGAHSSLGVYLRYPLDDLLALIALESARHRCIVIGEDLGTVPHGFRERLAAQGIAGLRVLLFERDGEGWRSPHAYPREAVAMTTTHDTATFAGWWEGRDIEVRDACGQLPPGTTRASASARRDEEKRLLAAAFEEAGCAAENGMADNGSLENAMASEALAAMDAVVAFAAQSRAQLVIVPLEDILGLSEQPNLPDTTSEHPNWRRRYPVASAAMMDKPAAERRLRRLRERG